MIRKVIDVVTQSEDKTGSPTMSVSRFSPYPPRCGDDLPKTYRVSLTVDLPTARAKLSVGSDEGKINRGKTVYPLA
tara:strand:- start:545 stop:772 length:228 start_codon:yes stop_codon:yes gene_type:complete